MDSDIVFVAYQDQSDEMIPVNEDGHLVVFDTFEAADAVKGMLGVVSPETVEGIRITCRQYRLKLPRNGRG